MINDKIRIEDININYIQYGSGKINMVLLHGWGQNIKMMMPIANAFKSIFKITIIDLPGFGSSDEPKEVLTITDYADIIHKLLNKLKIENPILVGHSFGGRISIAYASKYPVRKLILLASPFEKRQKSPSFKQKCLKVMKKIPILNKLELWAKNHFGSEDYLQFVPYELEEPFHSKDFAKAAHSPLSLAQTVLNILFEMGTIERVGKQGNSYLYRVMDL